MLKEKSVPKKSESVVLTSIIDIDKDISTKKVTSDVPITPIFKWRSRDGKEITEDVNNIYEQIVFWRKNLFLLPTGKAGKRYIDETNRLFGEWLRDSPQKSIALKAIMIMPGLILQKPSKNSKARDHLLALKRQLRRR